MPNCDCEIIDDLFCFDDLALFMKAYFDESGKHDAAIVISMVGILMSANTCKELQRRWLREAARSPKIPLPFHMSDCEVGRKAFEYLSDNATARWDMQRRMIGVLRGLDIQAYGAAIVREEHKRIAGPLRNDPRFRDPWFLAFETGIVEMMARSAQSGKAHNISFVFDRMDQFKPRANELYDELIRLPSVFSDRYGALSFEAKDRICALQAADVVVYETYKHVAECTLGSQPERWQHTLLRECIEISGKLYDKPGLEKLAELVAADRAGKLG